MSRDYKAEYKKFHSSDKAKKDRASRNNAASNLVCRSIKSNRGKSGEGGRRKGVAHNYPGRRKNSTGNKTA